MAVEIQVYNGNGNLYSIGEELKILLHTYKKDLDNIKSFLENELNVKNIITDNWSNLEFRIEDYDIVFNLINNFDITSRFYNNWNHAETLKFHINNITDEIQTIRKSIVENIVSGEGKDYLLKEFDLYTEDYVSLINPYFLTTDDLEKNNITEEEIRQGKIRIFLNGGTNDVALNHLMQNLGLNSEDITYKIEDNGYITHISFLINKEQLLKLFVTYNYSYFKIAKNTFLLHYNNVSDNIRIFMDKLYKANNTGLLDDDDKIVNHIINEINKTQLLFY